MARNEIEYVEPDRITIIGLDTDHTEGSHPLYDERIHLELDEALVKNIMVYGIQHPVLVRREGGEMYAVDGRQRVRAAREVAKRQDEAGAFALKVPVIEAKGEDRRMVGLMISLNEQRKATEILDRAEKAVRLLDHGANLEELSIAFGRSIPTIRGWIRLSKASPLVHKALKEGLISSSAAVELAKFETREEQEAELAKLTAAGERVSEAKAKKARRAATGTSAGDDSSPFAAPGESSSGGSTSSPSTEEDITPDSNPEEQPAEQPKKARKEVITTAEGSKKTTARKAKQSGIKRTWLRKALATTIAEGLTDEQRGVLRWFAYGEAMKGTWFDDFMFDAEMALSEKASDDSAD
jgi:ParB family chromosome partitioning protein